MRISFVSDIHGNVDGLAAAVAEAAGRADVFVVLGDLLDYVDYHDPAAGILGRVFGPDKVRDFIRLRTTGQFAALRAYNTALWQEIADPVGLLTDVVSERYQQVLDLLPPDTLLTLGNVDVAAVWESVAADRMPCRDAEVVCVDGIRFGFVAGGSTRPGVPVRAPDPIWQPLVRPAVEYEAAVAALGPVDVLCSHVPPALPALRFDVVPARLEMYGPDLLEYIDSVQPRIAAFGHVHQPLATRQRRGRTECLNAGHFAQVPRALEIQLD